MAHKQIVNENIRKDFQVSRSFFYKTGWPKLASVFRFLCTKIWLSQLCGPIAFTWNLKFIYWAILKGYINTLQSFSGTPSVFVSAKYTRDTKPDDAMYVWLENVNSRSFEVCIREFLPFDGKHQDTIVVRNLKWSFLFHSEYTLELFSIDEMLQQNIFIINNS